MALGDTGRKIGQAVGFIKIDTSEAKKAAGEMRSIGQDITKSFEGVSRGLNRTEKELLGILNRLPRGFGQAQSSVQSFISEFRTPPIQRFAQSVSGGVERIRQEVASKLGAARQSVGNFLGGLKNVGKGINVVRGELVALGAGAAVLGKIGLDGAKSIRNYRVSFSNLLGDEKQANDLMRQLTTQANDFGIEVEEVWQLARALLPSLQGNVGALDDFVKRAALIASTNPLKSTADAARAIQEYLAGQTISLQRLFNVDPNLIEEAQNRFRDVGEQLDFILGRMGATEEGARAMADGFVSVKNELKLVLAEGFTPLFQAIQPGLTKFREFLSNLRENHPEVLKLGAAFIVATAAVTPMILVLGRVLEIMQAIKALNLASSLAGIGPALGKAGVLGGALALGAAGGLALGKGIGRATGNDKVANTTVSDVATTIKRLVFIVVAGIGKLYTTIVSGISRAVAGFVGGIANMLKAIAGFEQRIGDLLGDNAFGDVFRQDAAGLSNFADALARGQQAVLNYAAAQEEWQREDLKALGDFLGLTNFSGASNATGTVTGGGISGLDAAATGPDLSAFDDQIAEATANYKERVADIEDSANEQRIQATRQYEQQRTSIIFEYNLQRAREAEDFARQRARQEEEFNRQIADILEERTQREQEWAADLSDRIAEIREEGSDRIAQIEEDGRIARERAERDHRFRLLDAARRLDATAVANEQRNFAASQADAAADLTRRLEQERVNLEERIAQEQAGHEQRLEQARAADEQRLADMVEQFERQKELEDEERAIALKRQEEDHQRQLAELERSNAEQLKEIQTSKQKELATLQAEYQKQLAEIEKEKAAELQAYQEANQQKLQETQKGQQDQLLAQQEGQEQSLESHRQYWQEANRIANEAVNKIAQAADNVKNDPGVKNPKIVIPDDPYNFAIPGFDRGGFAGYTGLARLHGSQSRPEFIADPSTTAAIRSILGNNFSQGDLVAAVAGGRSAGPVNANFYIYGATDPNAVARAVDGRLATLFRSVAG